MYMVSLKDALNTKKDGPRRKHCEECRTRMEDELGRSASGKSRVERRSQEV